MVPRSPLRTTVYKRALAICEEALGADHPEVAQALNNLAIVYQSQGKYGEAEALHKRALAIRERALGATHPEVAQTFNNLANVYKEQGKYVEALGLYKRSLKIREQAFGANHLTVADTLNDLAIVYYSQGNFGEAEGPGDGRGSRPRRAAGTVFPRPYRQCRGCRAAAPRTRSGARRRRVRDGPMGNQSSAAAAIQQMAARFGSGRGALADLVGENQDLAAAWRNQNSRLLDALLKPEDQQDRTAIEAQRQMIADTEARISAIATRLEKEFPNYDALTSPRPLYAEEVQKLLGADEGLVFLLTGDKESYVFALTRASFDWQAIPIGAKDLSAKVAAFRRGLDVEELRRTAETGKPVLFDLALAHELYAALIGPVEGLVKDKPHLLIVPTGTLTSLPFHLLVTEKPATRVPQLKDIAGYRDAPWLIKRQALVQWAPIFPRGATSKI